ncbi:MAG: hypothetical protein H0T43_03445 [Solirubrobacterales bacterium]|nr:hypothetical protein [Solirubrobacterales bacterium]
MKGVPMDDKNPAREGEAERKMEHSADELEERLENLDKDLGKAHSELEERKKDAEGRDDASI